MKKCPFCGEEIKEGAKFCHSCGKEIADESAVLKSVVKEAVEEGAKEIKEKVDELEKKMEQLEKGEIKLGSNINLGKHLGFDLKAQGRELKAQIAGKEHLYPAFSDEAKFAEYSKFVIDLVRGKALQEGTDSEGGYLVPEEFSADIIMLARNSSYALQKCNVMPMTRDVMKVPTESSLGATAWIDEEATITENNPAFGQVTLTAKKLGAFATVSNELLQDSAVDVVSLLTNQFAYKSGQALDNQVFQGDGTTFTGILAGTASGNVVSMSSGETSFDDISADDLSLLIEKLEQGYLKGANFVLGRLAMHYVRILKDSNNQPIYANPGGQVPGTIYGYPRIVSENMPNTDAADTKFVIFGNLKNYIVGQRLGTMTLEADPYGKFDTYQTRFRMVTRWGLAIGNANAFAVLKTAAS